MRRLTLREYETTPDVVLSPLERQHLSEFVPSLVIAARPGALDRFDLTPGSWVGGVDLGTLAVEIQPKLPIDRVLFLISYTLGHRAWRQSLFQAECHLGLVEAIITGFLAQVQRAFARGLLRGYRSQDESLPTVRGRIRFDDQIRNRSGLFPPVEVTYDEFTEDIQENRFLKAAGERLGRMRVRSASLRRRLLALENVLSSVQLVPFDPRRLPAIHHTRLNEHYRPAVELAKLILCSISYDTRHGAVPASAFLVDMNVVFENFVVLALRDALNLSTVTFPQEAKGRDLRLDEAGTIKLLPDISWWEGNRCVFVGDVKYKRTQHGDATNADLYQLLAYTVATNLPRGMLIYAAGEAQPGPYRVVHLGKLLEVVTLDLAGTPEEVLRQISAIASRIQQVRMDADKNLGITASSPLVPVHAPMS